MFKLKGYKISTFLRLGWMLAFIPLFLMGQSSYETLDIPVKFVMPSEETDLKDDHNNFKGYPWVVFSDRPYNNSYTRPDGKTPFKSLDYLSAYHVVDRQNQFLHLVKLTKIREGETESVSVEDFGWSEMSQLLLWNHCLVSPDNYCNKKAIVIYSEKTRYLFEDSDEAGIREGYRIFYIYKSFQDKYLLGSEPRIPKDADNASDPIVDWVRMDHVWVWDEVLALAPNCLFRNSLQRTEKPIPVLFRSPGAAKKYLKKRSLNQKDFIWDKDLCQKGLSASWLRFPITEEKNSVAKVVLFPGYNIDGDLADASVSYGYAALKDDPMNPMFQKVIIATKEDLGSIVYVYSSFFDKITPSSSFHEMADAWIAIVREERYDQRQKDLSMVTFSDINRMLFSVNQSNILPGTIPVQHLNASGNFQVSEAAYYQQLRDNLSRLREILNQREPENSFYSDGTLYFWLPVSLLP